MNAGKLRHRIDIERNTTAASATSGAAAVWAALYTGLWAAIWPLKGAEAVVSLQTQATVTHRMRIRFHAGILPSMRVRLGNRYFAIIAPAIDIDERHREMELLCQEVVYG